MILQAVRFCYNNNNNIENKQHTLSLCIGYGERKHWRTDTSIFKWYVWVLSRYTFAMCSCSCLAACDGLTGWWPNNFNDDNLYQNAKYAINEQLLSFRYQSIFDIMKIFLDFDEVSIFYFHFFHFDLDDARNDTWNEHIITQSVSREDKYSHHHTHAFSWYVSKTRAKHIINFVSTLRIPPISFSYASHCIADSWFETTRI